MSFDSTWNAYAGAVRSFAVRSLIGGAFALLASSPSAVFAQAQTACGADVKQAVVAALAEVDGASDDKKLATEQALYDKFKFCGEQDAAQPPPATFVTAARECGAAISNLGSLFYEEMPCAGYDPQRRQFAAPIKIKQTFGFGGAPLPGSREFVLHCVADAAGVLQPVGRDSVHLSDALPGNAPTWQFAVIVNASENLQVIYPMSNQTRRARSILSWNLRPTDCNYTPIWGNALNYRIRLDQ